MTGNWYSVLVVHEDGDEMSRRRLKGTDAGIRGRMTKIEEKKWKAARFFSLSVLSIRC